jgi:hypothetical protein
MNNATLEQRRQTIEQNPATRPWVKQVIRELWNFNMLDMQHNKPSGLVYLNDLQDIMQAQQRANAVLFAPDSTIAMFEEANNQVTSKILDVSFSTFGISSNILPEVMALDDTTGVLAELNVLQTLLEAKYRESFWSPEKV